VNLKELARYAVDRLEKGGSSAVLSKQLAALLVEQRRSRDLGQLMRLIESELDRRGKTQVTITSAHAVSDKVKKELAQALSAKNPVFHEEINPATIGGVRANTLEREIDLTIRTKLKQVITNVKES
jgi:F0F1-type ATP synthase delta subunit